LPTLVFTYSNASDSHIPIPGTYTLDVRRTPNQTAGDVTFSRSCYQGQITKKVWKIIMDV